MGEMTKTATNDQTEKLAKESLWRALWEAIRGTEADYTKINLRRAIFLLAVPMILESIGEALFALVDIYFVGQLENSASAIASVVLTESYLYLLYSIGMGVAMSVTAVIARRIGEKNREGAADAAVQSIFLAILISIPFVIAGIFFAKDLLAFMGGDQYALTEGYKFTQWMLGGNVVIMLLFIINAVFRGAGDAAIAMRVLLIANGINIILDPIFIFGWGPIPGFGVEGAGIATTIGRGIGVLIQLWFLFKGGKHIGVVFSRIKLRAKVLGTIVRTSLGGVGQMIVAMLAWSFIVRILSDISPEAVAGSGIAIRIMMFTMMPAWGMSNAAAALVGQNLGAGHPERAESSVWKIGFYNMYYMVAVSFLYYFGNEWLVGFFNGEPEVLDVGSTWLRILSYSFFVYGWWMVSVQAFNGAGDTKTPTWINVIFFWLIQIPWAWVLAVQMNKGYHGVFWAVFVSETGVGLFTLWLFSRGKWKKTKL